MAHVFDLVKEVSYPNGFSKRFYKWYIYWSGHRFVANFILLVKRFIYFMLLGFSFSRNIYQFVTHQSILGLVYLTIRTHLGSISHRLVYIFTLNIWSFS